MAEQDRRDRSNRSERSDRHKDEEIHKLKVKLAELNQKAAEREKDELKSQLKDLKDEVGKLKKEPPAPARSSSSSSGDASKGVLVAIAVILGLIWLSLAGHPVPMTASTGITINPAPVVAQQTSAPRVVMVHEVEQASEQYQQVAMPPAAYYPPPMVVATPVYNPVGGFLRGAAAGLGFAVGERLFNHGGYGRVYGGEYGYRRGRGIRTGYRGRR